MIYKKEISTKESFDLPEEIAEENPGASVMVTEGNKDTVLLPGDITTEDVHVIVDLAVVDTEEQPCRSLAAPLLSHFGFSFPGQKRGLFYGQGLGYLLYLYDLGVILSVTLSS